MSKKTDELLDLINQLEGHDIYNPDDEADLTNHEFLDVTDNHTRELVGQISNEAREILSDFGGEPDRRMINQLQRVGVRVDEDRITLQDGRYIDYR